MVCVLRTMLKHVPKGSGRFGKPGIVFSTQQSPQIKMYCKLVSYLQAVCVGLLLWLAELIWTHIQIVFG